MKKTLFILSNLLIGNLILALFVSSNFFLQSLILNFTIYYHLCFSLLIISSSFYFLSLAKNRVSWFNNYIFGFLTAFIPVAITTILIIGGPFVLGSAGDITYENVLFALEFSLLGIFTTGATYWLPFGILNAIYMRKNGDTQIHT